MRILFVGGGNMCQAIIGGLVAQGTRVTDIHAIEPLAETRVLLDRLGIASANEFHVRDLAADLIVLAVKPQMMKVAISPFAGRLASQLVVSIAAGIRCADLAQWLSPSGPGVAAAPYQNIVRAMPNTPALIRVGMTGLYALPAVSTPSRSAVETLLGSVGQTAWFDDEAMLDAVTAVSGSGPAYVFYFIEALEQAAQELGFADATARQFALQTFLGGARLAAECDVAPGVLRQRVTSKRGTTERAIDTFDALDLKRQIIAGVKAACHRSRELGDEMGRQGADENRTS
ncbi:MAG: pyrroline-5-carboxylate reductase [Betaproteobacteria bacterium]